MSGQQPRTAEVESTPTASSLPMDYRAVLERQVAERTHELQTKNAQLEDTLRQLKDMQQQLLTQQKLASLGALTAGIAHEMRNPLNFVNNFARLSLDLSRELRALLTQYQGPDDTETLADIEDVLETLEANMQRINEHGQRADRIVHGMLQHSRGQAGVREPTDLNALLAEYVNLAYHSMRAQDVAVSIQIDAVYDPTLGLTTVVPQDIGQVFLNLLNNALYAMAAKHHEAKEHFRPRLTVQTARRGDCVEIRIRDNGPGIAPEIREQIFQPFFTTKPAGEGTGLGLSICHDIVVQEHHGTLTVASEPGTYTEFVLTLPVAVA